MRLIETIIAISHSNDDGDPVTITMPSCALLKLATCIENDMGGRLYEAGQKYTGFSYAGVQFKPSDPKVQIAVDGNGWAEAAFS